MANYLLHKLGYLCSGKNLLQVVFEPPTCAMWHTYTCALCTNTQQKTFYINLLIYSSFIYPDQFHPPSSLPSPFPTSTSPFSSEKSRPRGVSTKYGITSYNTVRHRCSYYCWTRRSRRRKKVQRQARVTHVATQKVPQTE